MPFLELFDETLDINSTENYELSLQVAISGLSFSILDRLRNKFVLIRSHKPDEDKYFTTDELGEIIGKDDFLTKRYKKLSIITPSIRFTIVPSPLFDPAKKGEYFSLNHGMEENTLLLINKIADPDAYLIFPLLSPLDELLNRIYPGLQHMHHLKPLLRHISQSRKGVTGHYIHIHAEREFFNLIVFDHNTMRFCNAFTYKNISDILYFVINVFKRLSIPQEETIFLSGTTDKENDLVTGLATYLRSVKFAGPAGTFTFSYVFTETEIHRYLNLFSVINCE